MPSFLVRDLLTLARDDADRPPADSRVGRDERLAVVRFVFVERIGIDDRGEKIARVVRFVAVEADQIVNGLRLFRGRGVLLFRRVLRLPPLRARGATSERNRFRHDRIVLLVKIDRAADFGVHLRAAQFLGFDDLADGGFHQRRAGEIKAAAFGHQNLVAQHRQIRAAGDAVAHDGGELRKARGGDDGVVAKDAAEIVFVGKNLVLHRQKDAGGIDQVNNRQRAFEGDALGADQLLGGGGKKRAGFHGGVVGDDHAGNAGDVADAGDGAGGGNVAPLLVHFVGGPEPDFEKRRALIE